jgi:hypothetical protein
VSEVKTKIRGPDGKFVDGVELSFNVINNPETIAKLADGSEVRIKVLITKVTRLEGIYDQVTGDPAYFVISQPILNVISNPKLKKLD